MAQIIVHPSGYENDGSGQYRLRMPANALIAQGADVEISMTGPQIVWSHEWKSTPQSPYAPNWVQMCGVLPYNCEVVVFNRPAQKWWAECIPHLHAQGIRVVVDVDDRFNRIKAGNVAERYFDPGFNPQHNHLWIAKACQRADLVTASTPALINQYGYGHGMVLPNLVPDFYLNIKGRLEPTTCGWTGTTRTHPEDLQSIGQGVRRALEKNRDWRFSVVGDGDGVKRALDLPYEPSKTGWVPFSQYPFKMARFGIGVVALQLNKFNESKSCLKAMEFASLGIPVVMSAIPDNLRLNKLGVGRIAQNPGQWFKELDRLMRHESLRDELSDQGRAIMAGLTYEKHCQRWHDAWLGKIKKGTLR
jgi:hypothetical protein